MCKARQLERTLDDSAKVLLRAWPPGRVGQVRSGCHTNLSSSEDTVRIVWLWVNNAVGCHQDSTWERRKVRALAVPSTSIVACGGVWEGAGGAQGTCTCSAAQQLHRKNRSTLVPRPLRAAHVHAQQSCLGTQQHAAALY